jgi:predicted deacetylase
MTVVAVALHDVEPRTFDRVKHIRAWLLQRDIAHVTLLVIPAADLHPIGTRASALASWLRCRVARGDVVAQHGLVHKAAGADVWHPLGRARGAELQARVRAVALLARAVVDEHGMAARTRDARSRL